eukprot:COSAG01_NODE_557_length_15478_cov_45.809623_8_plen_360_part_00
MDSASLAALLRGGGLNGVLGSVADPRLLEMLRGLEGSGGGQPNLSQLSELSQELSHVLAQADPDLVRRAAEEVSSELGQQLGGADAAARARELGQHLAQAGTAATQAAAGAAAAPTAWTARNTSTPPPFAPWRIEHCRGHYTAELGRLASMGFPERVPSLRALIASGGDVELAGATMESRAQAAAEAQTASSAVRPGAEGEADREAVVVSEHQRPGPSPEASTTGDGGAWCVGVQLPPHSVAPPQLCEAVQNGDVDTVRRFLAHGHHARLWFVSEDVPMPGMFELLRVAVVEGHEQLVRLLLAQGGVDAEQAVNGCAPMYHAAWAGQLTTLRLLHEAGAGLNSVLYQLRNIRMPTEIMN